MSYYPILKNRQIENKIIKNILNSKKFDFVTPIIEVIKYKSISTKSIDYLEELEMIEASRPYFVDIVRKPTRKEYGVQVIEFISDMYQFHNYKEYYKNIVTGDNNMIPVISLSHNSNFDVHQVKKLLNLNGEKAKAIRLHSDLYSYFDFSLVSRLSREDFFFFDIGEQSVNNSVLRMKYKKIKKMIGEAKFVLLNSPRKESFWNTDIIDGDEIEDINNSAFTDYGHLNFDGFGDYAGVSKAMPSSGGQISPAGVFYDKELNLFYGYRRDKDLDEFRDYIVPSIMNSSSWTNLSKEHLQNCIGCSSILNIGNGKENGRSQGKWKGITINHYIYSVNEVLKNR